MPNLSLRHTPLALLHLGFVDVKKSEIRAGLFKAFITMYHEINVLKLGNKSFDICEKWC
jgi:hypothetical protein